MVSFLKKILHISKIFLKNLISFILFLPKFLTGLIIIAGLVFFFRFYSLDQPIDVEDGSALYIPMEGLIVEEKASNTDLRDIFFQDTNTPQIDLHQLLNAIEGAKNDNKILGIFIDLSDFLGGYPAELLKVTNQLEDFKLSGKFIIAYSDFFSQSAYIIASPSTEIISYSPHMRSTMGFVLVPSHKKCQKVCPPSKLRGIPISWVFLWVPGYSYRATGFARPRNYGVFL